MKILRKKTQDRVLKDLDNIEEAINKIQDEELDSDIKEFDAYLLIRVRQCLYSARSKVM